MFVCESLKGQLEFLVLVDAAPAELGLGATVEQAAAVSAQSVLDQIGEVVGGKLLLALHLVFVALLGGCLEQKVLLRVKLTPIVA